MLAQTECVDWFAQKDANAIHALVGKYSNNISSDLYESNRQPWLRAKLRLKCNEPFILWKILKNLRELNFAHPVWRVICILCFRMALNRNTNLRIIYYVKVGVIKVVSLPIWVDTFFLCICTDWCEQVEVRGAIVYIDFVWIKQSDACPHNWRVHSGLFDEDDDDEHDEYVAVGVMMGLWCDVKCLDDIIHVYRHERHIYSLLGLMDRERHQKRGRRRTTPTQCAVRFLFVCIHYCKYWF